MVERSGDAKHLNKEEILQELEAWSRDAVRDLRRGSGCLWNALGLLLIAVVVLLIGFGAIELRTWFASDRAQQNISPSLTPMPTPFIPTSTYEVLGTYQGEVLLFNRSTRRVYRYDPQTGEEISSFNLDLFEAFSWAPSGDKIAFLSKEDNPLGSLYVLSMTVASSSPDWSPLTGPNSRCPPDIMIQDSSPLVWSTNGRYLAFVARKWAEKRDAIFVVSVTGDTCYRLPEKDHITSFAWISHPQAEDKIVFVALENGKEKRFIVDCDGGRLMELQ